MPNLTAVPQYQILRDLLPGVGLLLCDPGGAGFGEGRGAGGAPEDVLAVGVGERGVVLQGVRAGEGLGVDEGFKGEGGGPEEGWARGAGGVFACCV